jgi:hypothetical protein
MEYIEIISNGLRPTLQVGNKGLIYLRTISKNSHPNGEQHVEFLWDLLWDCYYVKFTLQQATKAQKGSRYLTLPFLQPRL